MGEEDPIQFYRISLTITNDANLTKTSFVDLFPRTVSLKFDATFSGVLIAIDGEEFETPNEFIGVVGMEITIAAVISGMIEKGFFFSTSEMYLLFKDSALEFLTWSDGGAESHNITIPSQNTTYIITYKTTRPFTQPQLPVSFLTSSK